MHDILVIGGGVNGCGIARDAAGRGLSVMLAERDDLASGTSSASTKLIHGGLRYLEHFAFRLVRASLREREVLLSMAPHIIRPMRFVLPHHRALRPFLLLRLGLFLYDHLGGREILPASRRIDLRHGAIGRPLKDAYVRGFEYSDCWVDDARLVVLNARDAADRGAEIRPRTSVVGATRKADHWDVRLRGSGADRDETVGARVLVNAAGPWVSPVNDVLTGSSAPSRMRLVKGSHIVVPRAFEHDRAYVFQNADDRIVFAIPYEHDFTLIGTTDVDFDGDPATATITSDEIAYLCAAVSDYLRQPITPDRVVSTFSGVRPLHDSGTTAAQEATRDYGLDLDGRAGGPALLTVYGGKITTYRHLSEKALDALGPWLPAAAGPWTRGAALPGGDFPLDGLNAIASRLMEACAMLEPATARRWARAYGTRAEAIVAGARTADDLGIDFGAGLRQREVEYLVRAEWAMTAEDILWRRSKLGLRMEPSQVAALDAWLRANRATIAASAA